MKFVPLYGKDQAGGLKLWEIVTEGHVITVRHGKIGGKIQAKVTYAEPKNVGRANATTAEEQAVLEAEAKWVKQKKRGYFETKEEALGFICKTPMKAQNYNDYAHKIEWPCYQQPKLNGRRMLIDSNGEAQSKAGEPYAIPAHWEKDLQILQDMGFLMDGLDGEVFAGTGVLSLQQINSAFTKPNENTSKLCYYVYDIPAGQDLPQCVRFNHLDALAAVVERLGIRTIRVVKPHLVFEDVADKNYHKWVAEGYEGCVYRNPDAPYEFGKRSYNLIKRKPRLDAEALVVAVRRDKNDAGVLTCQLQNGVKFECLMRTDSDPEIDYRKMDAALSLVGQWVTFQYEELSDSGVPTKPVGTGVRQVYPATWEPIE